MEPDYNLNRAASGVATPEIAIARQGTEVISSSSLLEMAIATLQVVTETQLHLERKHNLLLGTSMGQEEVADKQITDNLFSVLRQLNNTSIQNLKLSQSL
jgi:hypothetical protein